MTERIPQPPGTCPGCAALQQQVDGLQDQVDALDRGLVEAGTTASVALKKATDIEAGIEDVYRRLDAQDEVWRLYSEGKAAAEVAREGGGGPSRPRRSRPRQRTGGQHLTAVQL